MLSINVLVAVCLGYVGFLFLIAFVAEKRAAAGRSAWLRSPWVYTLSLSIYCTGWTFYGAVGFAARSGLEFVTIYLGPTLVMVGWWALLRKLVQVGRRQRITSIADLISSRYGKSAFLGGLVTLLAVVGTTPYIALQLQSVTLSVAVFSPGDGAGARPESVAFWVAAGLVVFTILFGTRNLDVNERHDGVVTAIAVEAVVKLIALVAVGAFVVWGVAGGAGAVVELIDGSPIAAWEVAPDRWITLTFLAAAAFLTLPRMFHVLVVENSDESHLATASWAFPAYLLLISLFVVPIAVVGLATMPLGANPDLFVLTVPLAFDREWLAMLSFIGGFSSATSMVIVAAIALSTMVSNHVVLPIWLSLRGQTATMSGDVRYVVLLSRRISILGVLGLGYLYYVYSGGGAALAAIGLVSFAGLAQALPALLGAVFWRGATRVGAAAGLIMGLLVWGYTLFLPSFGSGTIFSETLMTEGPWGIAALRPQALLFDAGMDPLVHAVFWSLSLNMLAFLVGSLLSFPTPLERLQGADFVGVDRAVTSPGFVARPVSTEDLLLMSQRLLGPAEAQSLFGAEAARQGIVGYLPDPTPAFLERLEKRLAGSVGGATAHAMLAQITGGTQVSVEDLMRVADEAAQIMEYSSQLEAKSTELTRTAVQLREANDKLKALSIQKDAFLAQISHELRTPMTSIRAFSEILKDAESIAAGDRQKYSAIIHDESLRLTRLLDDLLDLNVLENGQVSLNIQSTTLGGVLDRAIRAADGQDEPRRLRIRRTRADENIEIVTDPDRLSQVFINIIANARKYCRSERPELTIRVLGDGDRFSVDFIDNGDGIPQRSQALIFEKFARLGDHSRAGGAGLGLAICREIMAKLGGAIDYLPGQGGAAFRVTLPPRRAQAA
ncbi:MAG: sensor histidine kinase [Pseudomonadota bacterium]